MKTSHATYYSFGWVAFIKEDGIPIFTIGNRIFETEKEALDHARQAIENGIQSYE